MVWVAEQPGWGGLLDIWIKFLSVKVSVPFPVLMTQPENIQPKNTIIQGCNPHEAANWLLPHASPTIGACSPIPVYSFTMVGKMVVLFLTKQGFTRVADEPVSTTAGQHVPPIVQQSPTQVQPGATRHSSSLSTSPAGCNAPTWPVCCATSYIHSLGQLPNSGRLNCVQLRPTSSSHLWRSVEWGVSFQHFSLCRYLQSLL